MNNKINLNRKKLFEKQCKQNHLRITPQRSVIFQSLTDSPDHPTADMIYQQVKKQFPNISFDTVNRTLITFAEIGLVNLVEGYGESRRFEPNLNQHHHFRCIKCHKIIDFQDDDLNSIKIPENIKSKFKILNQRVVLEGLCDQCCLKN
ncbi:MAG: Fur family transcriptional regulator [Desulfuromonas sp. SDB]|nr:MAG: Fur family transcriptional regulator [Desulfuromonas sp. SDB]